MKSKKVISILATIIVFGSFIIPDYLIVSRHVTIKEEPNGDAKVLTTVESGDYLQLLSTEHENGYFNVHVPNTPIDGWVYRTFVRRYEGEIPNETMDEDVPADILSSTDLVARVIDVGAGLCVVIQLPNGNYVIYDAGHYRGYGKTAFNQIKEVVPRGSVIEQ